MRYINSQRSKSRGTFHMKIDHTKSGCISELAGVTVLTLYDLSPCCGHVYVCKSGKVFSFFFGGGGGGGEVCSFGIVGSKHSTPVSNGSWIPIVTFRNYDLT